MPGATRTDVTLGELIAAYRRRRRQPHRNAPWSQEELAFAAGTDQAHISRIETNRQHPEYSTLARICDALGLSPTERAHLFALAGYHVAPPLPDAEAVADVLRKLAPLIDSYPYPSVLLDEGERIWHVNPVFVAVLGETYGADTQEGCLARVRGRRVVELIFDPDPRACRLPVYRRYYADIDHVLMRILVIFWRVYRARLHDPELERLVRHLKRNPEFAARWQRIEEGTADVLFIEHFPYVVTHPRLGPLHLHAWRTRVTADERFIVVHFTPVNSATSQLLSRLAQSAARRPDEAAP